MANIFDLAATASSITAFNGVSVAEGMDADKVNDAMRELGAICYNTFSPTLENFLAGTAGLPITSGGTGATTANAARINLGAAAYGANGDISSLYQSCTIQETGTVYANSLGFRGVPVSSKASGYTLTDTDEGKLISITTGGVAAPANASTALPIGYTAAVYNDSGTGQTISVVSDTLRLAGTTSTGNRTLAAYGVCTLIKVASTTWVVSGNVS